MTKFGLLLGAWCAALTALGGTVSHHSLLPVPPRDTLGTAEVVAPRVHTDARATVSTQTLDSAALDRRGITDIGDALRRIAGITLRDYGGAGGLKTVSVRGMGAAHTVVMYDGLPMSESRTGQTDLNEFTLDRLATLRFEAGESDRLLCPVRRLGAAALILNPARPDTATRRRIRASLCLGSFGVIQPALSVALRTGRTVTGCAADFRYADNDYPFTLPNGPLTEHRRREGSRMQRGHGEIYTRHTSRLGDRLTATLYYDESHQRLPGPVLYYAEPSDERLTERHGYAGVTWNADRGLWSMMAAAKYTLRTSRYADRDEGYPDGILRQHYRGRDFYATMGAARRVGAFTLAYAADGTMQQLRSNLSSDARVRRLRLDQALSAAYNRRGTDITARLLHHLSVDRVEGASGSNAREWEPSLTAARTLLTTGTATLRGRASFACRMRLPSFTEAYYYHYGAARLRPETSRQWSAGMTLNLHPRHTWLHALTLTADGYTARVSDRIMSVPVNLFVWHTMNLGRVRQSGADATLTADIRPVRGHALLLSGNYSLQRSVDRTLRGSAGYGLQLAYTPRYSGSLSAAYEWHAWGLAAHTTFAAERWSTNEHSATTRLPAYAETGFALYTRLRLGTARLHLRADIINALDRRYEIIRRYPMPGRNYRLTANINL